MSGTVLNAIFGKKMSVSDISGICFGLFDAGYDKYRFSEISRNRLSVSISCSTNMSAFRGREWIGVTCVIYGRI